MSAPLPVASSASLAAASADGPAQRRSSSPRLAGTVVKAPPPDPQALAILNGRTSSPTRLVPCAAVRISRSSSVGALRAAGTPGVTAGLRMQTGTSPRASVACGGVSATPSLMVGLQGRTPTAWRSPSIGSKPRSAAAPPLAGSLAESPQSGRPVPESWSAFASAGRPPPRASVGSSPHGAATPGAPPPGVGAAGGSGFVRSMVHSRSAVMVGEATRQTVVRYVSAPRQGAAVIRIGSVESRSSTPAPQQPQALLGINGKIDSSGARPARCASPSVERFQYMSPEGSLHSALANRSSVSAKSQAVQHARGGMPTVRFQQRRSISPVSPSARFAATSAVGCPAGIQLSGGRTYAVHASVNSCATAAIAAPANICAAGSHVGPLRRPLTPPRHRSVTPPPDQTQPVSECESSAVPAQCVDLYRDHSERQMRLQTRVNEKKQQENESFVQQLEQGRGTGPYDRRDSLQWYGNQLSSYRAKEESLRLAQQVDENECVRLEMAEGTFAFDILPLPPNSPPESLAAETVAVLATALSTARGSMAASEETGRSSEEDTAGAGPCTGRPQPEGPRFLRPVTGGTGTPPLDATGAGSGSSAASAQEAIEELQPPAPRETVDLEAMATALVATQAAEVARLRKLDVDEAQMRQQMQLEAEGAFKQSFAEGRRKLQRFIETVEGQEYLAGRTRRYMEPNDGLTEDAACAEAREDLLRASEVKLRTKMEADLQERFQNLVQQMQVQRLRAARELILLQKQADDLVTQRGLPQSMLEGFDDTLVDTLTQAEWYLEARRTATRILCAEASRG